jgi:hypothetical protein
LRCGLATAKLTRSSWGGGAETRTALLKAAVPFIEQYDQADDH